MYFYRYVIQAPLVAKWVIYIEAQFVLSHVLDLGVGDGNGLDGFCIEIGVSHSRPSHTVAGSKPVKSFLFFVWVNLHCFCEMRMIY